MKIELKPCPFCGQMPEIRQDYRYPRPECNRTKAYEVICMNWDCPIYKADYNYYFSEADAIKAWNTRAGESNGKA